MANNWLGIRILYKGSLVEELSALGNEVAEACDEKYTGKQKYPTSLQLKREKRLFHHWTEDNEHSASPFFILCHVLPLGFHVNDLILIKQWIFSIFGGAVMESAVVYIEW